MAWVGAWVCAWIAATSACAPRAEVPPNVLLITVDTLRADHLGCYGYPRPTSPRLDALAAEGLLFTRVTSPRAKTTPAIASLLSGRLPHEHGVRDLTRPLSGDVPLLQERLRAAGYRTGAIVGNWVLGDERSGLARGFDSWTESLPDARGVPPHDVPERTARSLTDGALVALGLAPATEGVEPRASFADAGRPWFLWLHYMDPHGAYEAPPEHRLFASAAPDPIADAPTASTLGGVPHALRVAEYNVPAEARSADGSIDAARVRDLYDAEVHYADAEIGRLIEALRGAGLLERTLVVVTSDHGESLGEQRYYFEHGLYAYESTCRVPLIVRVPRALRPEPPRGIRGANLALADLAPTLAELAGVDSAGLAGSSRAALIDADDASPRPAFCEKVERADEAGAVQIKAVRAGDWKLIHRYAFRSGRADADEREPVLLSEELYDLARDPLEARDLSGSSPDAPLGTLRRELARFVAADRDFARIAELLQQRREDLEREQPDAARILRALGY